MKKLYFILYIAFLSSCANPDSAYVDPRGSDYAGSESCVQCHAATVHQSAAHAHTWATAPGTGKNVLGDFRPGHNTFAYEKQTELRMERRGDSVYHVLYQNGQEVRAYNAAIVFGGRMAQTSVYWKNKNTFELPLSWYRTANHWGTSPGFSSNAPFFDRQVIKDCYACHSSNASSRPFVGSSQQVNFMTGDIEDVIDPKTIVYGIDCERCHGPARQHVEYHRKFPDEKTAQFITRYQALSNTQKLEACGICHAGTSGLRKKSAFAFKPGDKMVDYYLKPQSASYDVHGNQYGMLTQSKCFTASNTLNCLTCHNAHTKPVGKPEQFTAVCLRCHQTQQHAAATLKTINLRHWERNCVECHMPKQPSRAITFQQARDSEFSKYLLHAHKIGIYGGIDN